MTKQIFIVEVYIRRTETLVETHVFADKQIAIDFAHKTAFKGNWFSGDDDDPHDYYSIFVGEANFDERTGEYVQEMPSIYEI